jgi:hypothetical protein
MSDLDLTLGALVLIDGWLAADLQAPRKQHHIARRIWRGLREEHGADVSEREVDRYVASRQRLMGEVEAPLVSDAGVEAGVDWGQAQVILRGQPVEGALVLDARMPFGRVVRGDVPGRDPADVPRGPRRRVRVTRGALFALVRYDNLKAAVTRVLKSQRHSESDRFVALRSHYLFESVFCQRGERGAYERGGVESEVGRSAAVTSPSQSR